MDDEKIENFRSPGRTERVNRAKYEAMRYALLAILPDTAPGLKVPEATASSGIRPSGCSSGCATSTASPAATRS